jgi:pyruvate dehydrogenase E2 component (dihydrolipoamide acetyltransferase)
MADVVMPQMGESVAEGTIVRWLKQVGEAVERDETLLEISTDKVDAEIPAPASGVVTEIRYQAGATVDVNTVIAVIGQPESVAGSGSRRSDGNPANSGSHDRRTEAAEPVVHHPELVAATLTTGDGSPQRVSPVARNVAAAHGVDLASVTGTGIGGRIMKADVLAKMDGADAGDTGRLKPAATNAPAASAPMAQAASGVETTVVPMTVMRKKIAEHMVESKRTSAHVHTVIEVDFTAVEQARQALKAEYERQGAKLTYLSFILKAVAGALKAVPVVNASVRGDQVVYHAEVNVGIAVALESGLIVPVIRDADRKSLRDISIAIADLATRARDRKLKPEEVGGGTFTVTNPGSLGTLLGFPIINQPQVAILCAGVVEKRVVSVNDALAIRRRAYFTIGYDHRVIDGAVADDFLVHVKDTLEKWTASEDSGLRARAQTSRS